MPALTEIIGLASSIRGWLVRRARLACVPALIFLAGSKACDELEHMRDARTLQVINDVKFYYHLKSSTYDFESYKVNFDDITAPEIGYAGFLGKEFGLYSPRFLESDTFRRVVLCDRLRLDEGPRAGIPEFTSKTLFLDVSFFKKDVHYHRSVIHHEIFHMILESLRDEPLVAKWKALNAPGFRYGNGGESMQDDPLCSLLVHPRKGFVNRYSTASVEEDLCEIYTNLLVSERALKAIADGDEIVAGKVELMKAFLKRSAILAVNR